MKVDIGILYNYTDKLNKEQPCTAEGVDTKGGKLYCTFDVVKRHDVDDN